jgi:hypothetical protein
VLIWLAVLGIPAGESGADTRPAYIALWVGLALAGLVVARAALSSFYQAMPALALLRLIINVHDVLGTVAWFAVRVAAAFTVAFVAAIFRQSGQAFSGTGGRKDSAIDRNGVIYRKNAWMGNWEPEQGWFGPKTDRGLFGPNIRHGWFGPEEKRDGLFATPQHGSNGEALYERD